MRDKAFGGKTLAEIGVFTGMDGLTSQTAIEEFVKQGIHSRAAKRASWPAGNILFLNGEDVLRLNSDGTLTELSDEDLDATDWTLNEHEFL